MDDQATPTAELGDMWTTKGRDTRMRVSDYGMDVDITAVPDLQSPESLDTQVAAQVGALSDISGGNEQLVVPEISIVIPAFNEAHRLPGSLAAVKAYLDEKATNSEVIVVDDGSTDGTGEVVQDWLGRWPKLRLVRGAHSGKGGAVRAGVLAAQGRFVALADADFSMPIEDLECLTTKVMDACDLAIASREAPGAQRHDEPWHRHLMSRVFNLLVRIILLPGIRDTQCGFKCLRREVAVELCKRQTVNGWGFDPELLYIARRRGYRVHEVPISWTYVPGSRVHPVRDALRMVRELLSVHSNGRYGIYDH